MNDYSDAFRYILIYFLSNGRVHVFGWLKIILKNIGMITVFQLLKTVIMKETYLHEVK